MPDLRVGSSQVSNVKVGSTQVSAVYAGANLVWSNIVVTTNPANGFNSHTVFGSGTATAGVQIFCNRSVTWSFSRVNGSTSFTTGAGSGTSTTVSISNSANGVSVQRATVDVTATSGGVSVTTRVIVQANKEIISGEGGP
jgi:hypothetical protein